MSFLGPFKDEETVGGSRFPYRKYAFAGVGFPYAQKVPMAGGYSFFLSSQNYHSDRISNGCYWKSSSNDRSGFQKKKKIWAEGKPIPFAIPQKPPSEHPPKRPVSGTRKSPYTYFNS
jgi:hypothetical protein